MFTKNNTMNEILNTEPVSRAIGNLFPTCFLNRVPLEHRDHTMAQIEKEETMEWGAPFLADAFLECANLIKETAETKKFKYIPLWGETDDASAGVKMPHWEDGIPQSDLNTEEGVWLFTGDPAVDNEAFAHTAGSDSIPPYESTAVAEEKKNKTDLKPAVILCPGGGYEMVSFYNEGLQPAQRMERDGGYKAFVLCYRIRPNYYPLPQMDLARAVMYVRAHAAEYQVDPERIVIMGASAGGHLCASEALLHEELKENVLENLAKFQKADMVEQYRKISARPDAVGLLYPVISFTSEYHEGSYIYNTNEKPGLREKLSVEFHITSDYPMTYAYANADDGCVPASNTMRLNEALEKAGVKHLCEVYPTGDHGIGLGYHTSAKMWSENMLAFFDQNL